jgi:hypothetical protein
MTEAMTAAQLVMIAVQLAMSTAIHLYDGNFAKDHFEAPAS